MLTALVSIKVVIESEACLTYVTFKWHEVFMHHADMSHQVVFPPKALPTPFVLALESTRAPRSRHGSKYPKDVLFLSQAYISSTAERTGSPWLLLTKPCPGQSWSSSERFDGPGALRSSHNAVGDIHN